MIESMNWCANFLENQITPSSLTDISTLVRLISNLDD